MIDPLHYYRLEDYLFETVQKRFSEDHAISAFDFFSIVIWKANRAKSKIAKRLLQKDSLKRTSLDAIVRDITSSLSKAHDARTRLSILVEHWGFRLPMASAILTVLWPSEFTVYDFRACDSLGIKDNLEEEARMDRLWPKYTAFVNMVSAQRDGECLRDKDRVLWARSAIRQLERDLSCRFERETQA